MRKFALFLLLSSIALILLTPRSTHAEYNPTTGRFLQRDPLGINDSLAVIDFRLHGTPLFPGDHIPSHQYYEGMNLYQYVHSLPTMLVDKYGLYGKCGECVAPFGKPRRLMFVVEFTTPGQEPGEWEENKSMFKPLEYISLASSLVSGPGCSGLNAWAKGQNIIIAVIGGAIEEETKNRASVGSAKGKAMDNFRDNVALPLGHDVWVRAVWDTCEPCFSWYLSIWHDKCNMGELKLNLTNYYKCPYLGPTAEHYYHAANKPKKSHIEKCISEAFCTFSKLNRSLIERYYWQKYMRWLRAQQLKNKRR
jgi:hypothetical protein